MDHDPLCKDQSEGRNTVCACVRQREKEREGGEREGEGGRKREREEEFCVHSSILKKLTRRKESGGNS